MTATGNRLWRLRGHLGLTQREFAARFGLTYGNVRDTEQGRVSPLPAMRVLIAAIEGDPEFMARVASADRPQGISGQ